MEEYYGRMKRERVQQDMDEEGHEEMELNEKVREKNREEVKGE